jgi:hypothetical protein
MEKTKLIVLTAVLAVLALAAIVGAAYAQSLNAQSAPSNINLYSQVPTTGPVGTYNGVYGSSGMPCLGQNGYSYGPPRNGYSYGMGMRGGMIGGYYR